MANYSVKKIDEMEGIYGGAFKRARAELGIESFGMQVIDMPPNADQYPEHDHSEDGQEEVYLALRGSADIEIEGETHRLDPESERRQVERLRAVRASRDQTVVDRMLKELTEAARDPAENLMPATIAAVRARASMGEIVNALREVFGTYVETPIF